MNKKISFRLPLSRWVALVFLFVAAYGTENACAQSNQEIVDAHNVYRTEVGVAGLTWSDDLASYAQAWANELANNRKCELLHRPTTENDPWKQKYGENIFWGGGDGYNMLSAVKSWGDEKKDYNLATKTCKDGAVCGHYTQILWKTTTKVGCAIAKCPDGNVIVVCNYDPAGNMGGETPF